MRVHTCCIFTGSSICGEAVKGFIAIIACGSVFIPGRAFAQADPVTGLGYVAPLPHRNVPADGWRDPAPHRALGVNVSPDVRIHVLDFGGSGTPLVFLSGIGNNAHVFDDFAQRFTRTNRVIALTRRGFGESSHPETGYDQPTLAADVITVLDSLGIRRALLAGHSIGGYEITHIAATYPERVLGLIYLDAGSDPVSADSIRKARAAIPAPAAPPSQLLTMNPPMDADSASARAAWAYRVRNGLTDNTEAAVRAAYFYEGFNPYLANRSPFPPKMLAAIRSGGPTPFGKVVAPAIFILAEASSDLAKEQRAYAVRALKGSKLVTIPGARHLIFFSHPDEVEREMKQFIAAIQDS